jgi:hypothetical protein
MLKGGCHCKSIRYETDGTPFHATICHCADCRGVTGAAAVAWFSVPRDTLRWIGSVPVSYTSSPGVTRRFCGVCGTTLSYEADAHASEIDIATATLDDPDLVPPVDHVFVSQRPRWDKAGNNLPQHARGRNDG